MSVLAIIEAMQEAGCDDATILRAVMVAERKRLDNLRDRVRKHREGKASDESCNVTSVTAVTRVSKERSPHTPLKENNPPIVPPSGDVCEFENFWTAYPRKQGTSKPKARDAFRKLDPGEQKQALATVGAFARSVAQTEERYVPHAATWLNQRRFETLDAGRAEIAPEVWRIWVKRFQDDGGWPRHEHGPPPGRAGCRCPAEILAEFGYTQSKELKHG